MTSNLFSSLHFASFFTNVFLLSTLVPATYAFSVWQRSALQEAAISVMLNSVTVNISDSSDTSFAIDLNFTCADSLVLKTIDSFSFAIAYDPEVLTLFDVFDNGLQSECGWFFSWMVVNNPDSIPHQKSVLRLVGKDNTDGSSGGLACHESENPLITVEFHTSIDLSQYDGSTTVDFCWLNCNDNVACAKDSDTIPLKLMALQVFDAYGVDITNESDSLPSFCGPNSFCFEQFGDTVITRGVRFQSGKFDILTDVVETTPDHNNLPSSPDLAQNYPDPFNLSTNIEFTLPVSTDWRVEILNLNGQIVTTFSGDNGPGTVVLSWDGRDRSNKVVSSGVYFYRLLTEKHSTSKKMLLLK